MRCTGFPINTFSSLELPFLAETDREAELLREIERLRDELKEQQDEIDYSDSQSAFWKKEYDKTCDERAELETAVQELGEELCELKNKILKSQEAKCAKS